MEYKIIENNLSDFWEDKNKKSFGDKKVAIKLDKDIIQVESLGGDVFLQREGKRAKISTENKIVRGTIKDKDKLFLEDGVIIEFEDKKNILTMPKVNWNLWMGVMVLLLIMVVIFLGWKKTTEVNAENNYQKVYAVIKDNIDKSENIKSMDPETGLKLLNEAKGKIQEIKSNKKHENETNDLEKIINDKLAVGGSNEVIGFEELYDTKIADIVDRKYDKMEVFGEVAILVDRVSKKIVELNLMTKQVKKYDIDAEITNIIDLSFANKKIYFYDGRNIFDISKNKIADVGEIVYSKIISWNNSWYLLGQDGKIGKLTDGKTSQWTTDSAKLIDKPISMAIDGTVWVTDVSGNVANYEKGVVKKWEPSIRINDNILGITTTANSTKIAVVSDKKVYVFEKNSGKLLATNNLEKVGIIDAKMGINDQIFVLAKDQKIYKVK